MNGLYTPVEEENESPSVASHRWEPGIGYQSAGPKALEDIAADSRQRTTLDDLARMAEMSRKVAGVVEAYENYADNIEAAWQDQYEEIERIYMTVAGVPEWWRLEVLASRGLRNALVKTTREMAQRVAEIYGVR